MINACDKKKSREIFGFAFLDFFYFILIPYIRKFIEASLSVNRGSCFVITIKFQQKTLILSTKLPGSFFNHHIRIQLPRKHERKKFGLDKTMKKTSYIIKNKIIINKT